MTADDHRTAYLAGDDAGDALDEAARAELDDVRALLADPSLWAEPPEGLEASVVAAVAAEASRAAPAMPIRSASDRRTRWRALPLVGAAAALVLLAMVLGPWTDPAPAPLEAALAGTELAPGAEGTATLAKTDAGWRIELDATGLPRLDDGRFYQAWLTDGAGDPVPIGTFNEPEDVVLWAGVSPRDFPTLTVTAESVSDGTPASGQRVLAGAVVEP
jgi:anti-sigma-K factor RskA